MPDAADTAYHLDARARASGPPAQVRVDPAAGRGSRLSVEALVHCPAPRAEAMQVLVSRWAFAEDLNGFATCDAGRTDGLDTAGYFGAVCDGRHVYFAPQCNHRGRHGLALRLDTLGDLGAPASWAAADAERTGGLETRGYYGALYDGRHVHYVPRTDGRTHHSRILRFDTRADFREPAGWSAHDAGPPVSYQGGAFDGRFAYFAPGYHQATGPSGLVMRYDTSAPFAEAASYACHDAASTSGLRCVCYDGAVYDGRHVYFVPLERGPVLRCDTCGDFASPDSWEAHALGAIDGVETGMCVGAVFDGRYLYLAPYAHSVVVRYDTGAPFDRAGSWRAYDAGTTSGLRCRGYDGAAFDGRYVYFIPFWEGEDASRGFHARLLRYDRRRDFADPGAWLAADGSALAPPNPGGFNGGAFDGRYLYLAPWRQDAATTDIHPHGQVLRYDTAGAGASFCLKFMDCGHNGGLCGAVPGPTFAVNTAAGVVSARASTVPAAGWHHLVGTYDGRALRLYLDGALVGEGGEGGARLAPSSLPVQVGGFAGGTSSFDGRIAAVVVTGEVLSAQQVAARCRAAGPGA
ncbi:MAG: LamG domain-containing protein [Gemmatimonadota bacterium]